MSHDAVDLAFLIPLPHLQKHVLMALAYRRNFQTGRCDPSIDTIARDCGMSKSSVKNALRALQSMGLIETVQRREGAESISNFYKLNFLAGVGQEVPRVGHEVTHVGQEVTEGESPQTPGVGQDVPPKGEVKSGRERKTTADAVEFILPDWIDQEAWKAYEEMRKKIRKPLTPNARELVLKKLTDFEAEGLSSTAALNESVMSSWAGVFKPKVNKGDTYAGTRPSASVQRSNDNMELLANLLSGEADCRTVGHAGGDEAGIGIPGNDCPVLEATLSRAS